MPGNSVAVGSVVSLIASVSSSGAPVSPGLVVFCNAEAAHCEDFNILGQAQLTTSGSASLNLILPIGAHQIRAEFLGTLSNAPSSSSTEGLTVAGMYPTVTTISAAQSPNGVALRGKVTSIGYPGQTGTLNFPDLANHLIPLATLTVGSPTYQLTPVPETPGTTTSTSGAVADFNRDGKLDQLTYDSANNSVTVLFGNGDGTFFAGPAIPVGTNPDAIAVGDFNNDDILDFAVANYDNSNVYIFLGKGDGTFSAPTAISVGKSPNYISVGEFNSDGNADLVVSSSAGLSIWLGNGKGGFSLFATPTLPQAFSSIRVVDLNGDGHADLVYSIQTSIHVSLGNGDGTFTTAAATSVPCGSKCTDAVVADFNGDGEPDLAVSSIGVYSNGSGGVFVMSGNGDGTFGSPTVFPYFFALALSWGDLKGDGKGAICEGDLYFGGAIFWDNGDGTFVQGQWLPASVSAMGDFNSDGMTDLAFGSPTGIYLAGWFVTAATSRATVTGGLGVHNVFANYEGDANHAASVSSAIALQGPRATTTTALTASPTPIALGEVMQLVATVTPSVAGGYRAAGTITFSNGPNALGVVPLSDGRAAFSTTALPIGSNISLTAYYSGNAEFTSSVSLPVRLTGGGRLRPGSTVELSVSPSPQVSQGSVVTLTAKVLDAGGPVTAGLVLFYGSTSAQRRATVLGQAQLTPSGVATMKYRPPIGALAYKAVYQGVNTHAAGESAPQGLTVTGKIATSTVISANPPTFTADVTAYGLLAASGDVSFVDATDSSQTFATASLGPATSQFSLTPATTPNVATAANALAVADFNEDGILDIVTYTSAGLTILLGNPDGTFAQAFANSLITAPVITVADFNSDGIPDIASLDWEDSSVTILLGRGDGTFNSLPAFTVGSNGSNLNYSVSIVSGDFNGDGIPDLITANFSNNSTGVLLGSGDGTFHAVPSPNLAPAGWPVGPAIVADLNGDGIPDVVTPMQGGVSIFLGNGDGTFVAKFLPVSPDFDNGTVAAADYNGDGIQDLVVTGGWPGISMLLGNGDATFTPYTLPVALPYSVLGPTAADLNGDGIPDLVLVDESSPDLEILLGRGDGTFAEGPVVPTPDLGAEGASGGAIAAAVGDFNGDGIPDVLAMSGTYTLPNSAVYEWFSSITQTSPATATNVMLPGSGTQQVFATYPGDTTHLGSVSATAPSAAAELTH